MINFSNKWKILSVGLMVILASGLGAPQAYALINQDILSVVNSILSQLNNSVYGLKAIHNQITTSSTSLTALQTTANAIKAKTDNLPPDPASATGVSNGFSSVQGKIATLEPKTIDFNATSHPDDGSSLTYHILNGQTGTSYSGIISGAIVPSGNAVELWCSVSHRFTFVGGELGGNNEQDFTIPFACKDLSAVVSNNGGAGVANIQLIVQYYTSTQITTIG